MSAPSQALVGGGGFVGVWGAGVQRKLNKDREREKERDTRVPPHTQVGSGFGLVSQRETYLYGSNRRVKSWP